MNAGGRLSRKRERLAWPLEEVRVVDLTQNAAGPYAGMILGELGATVTKIEPLQGDVSRIWGPPFWGKYPPVFLSLNRNKEFLRLDLKSTEGRKRLADLLETADVMLVSSRPGVMKRMQLDFDSVIKEHPCMIYGEVTPFGNRGPRALEPGYDPVMQALTGIMSVNTRVGEPPSRVGVPVIDMTTGLWLALGILAALHMVPRSGHKVSVSLFEVGVSWMASYFGSYWATGISPHGWGTGMPYLAPYEAFQTRDGWVFIAAGNDTLFEKLSRAMGHPEWTLDRRFRTNMARVKNRRELASLIGSIAGKKKTAEVERLLKPAGVPTAPVRNVAEALNEPQLSASGMIQTLPHPSIPGFKSVGVPLTIDGSRPRLRAVPI